MTRLVNFFSKVRWINNPNTRFNFNSVVDDKFVFTGSKTFTLSNGTSLTDSKLHYFNFNKYVERELCQQKR